MISQLLALIIVSLIDYQNNSLLQPYTTLGEMTQGRCTDPEVGLPGLQNKTSVIANQI